MLYFIDLIVYAYLSTIPKAYLNLFPELLTFI